MLVSGCFARPARLTLSFVRFSLNSAHGTYSKLFKRVFPSGLDAYHRSLPGEGSEPSTPTPSVAEQPAGFLSRWFYGQQDTFPMGHLPDGPLEEFIMHGSAFGEDDPRLRRFFEPTPQFQVSVSLVSCFLSSPQKFGESAF